MTTVKQIEEAIARLPREQLTQLRRWFDKLDAAQWDRQFDQDVNEGRLDALADQALKSLHKGRCTEL